MNYTEIINNALLQYLPDSDDIVSRAIRYSVGNGGKRIRPALVLEFCRVCGGNIESALPLACAVEMIHSYSLIHDDLPCMDDDDFRRGKPSCHIAFGEEYALLAGDALLTLAFETAAEAPLPAERVVSAVSALSKAAGWAGMVGGQVLDLLNEGREDVTLTDLEETDKLKTGELIRVSCELGCIAAGAGEKERNAARAYAAGIGLAFQIVDDILDVTGDESALGKPIGSDESNDKQTYVSLLGIDKSKETAQRLTQSAISALDAIDADTSALEAFADSLIKRES